MFCAKDEKNSLLATLWFNVAHYALRPWPWILVALASLISIPGPRETRDRLHARDDRLPAAVAARPDGGGVRGGVHVDHRDAAQLGRELSGERFLPPLPETGKSPSSTT